MDQTERGDRHELKYAIEVLRDWQPGKQPLEIYSTFINLQYVDQSKNKDLWNQIRELLATKDAFQHPEVLQTVTHDDFAEEGYWWFDLANWKQPAPADTP